MSEERRRILDMLAEGKITAAEAEELLAAIEEPPASEVGEAEARSEKKPDVRYLRVIGNMKDGDRFNVRVPLQLIRAGVTLGAVLPKEVTAKVQEALSEKGINIDLANVSAETVDELVQSLGELQVIVNSPKGKLCVMCE